MKNAFLLLIMAFVSTFSSLTAGAVIDADKEYRGPIGRYIQFFQNEDNGLTLSGAIEALGNGKFVSSGANVINFGLGTKLVWLAFQVDNHNQIAVLRNLMLENAWLDKVEVFFLRDGLLADSIETGDSLPFVQRPADHRFFVIEHSFRPGRTLVLVRIQSDDSMVLPVYFMTAAALAQNGVAQAYSYGFMYGVILALVAYNFVLYIGLRSSLYLFYSLYLLFFIALNVAYTGHGYQWLWPESPYWQRWASPVLMMACTLSGLAFTLQFLNIRQSWPRVYRGIIFMCGVFVIAGIMAMVTEAFMAALSISLVFIFFFYVLALMLGVGSLRAGNAFAKYFLLASIFTITGGAVTANATWGNIPFN